MRILLTTMLCLALAAGAFAADRTVTVTPIDGPLLSIDQAAPNGVCVYGNNNAAVYGLTNTLWGQESYATAFNAPQEACGCAAGFTIEQVHFYINFGAEDVPATFNVSVDFLEAGPSDCPAPGALICGSPVYQVTITNPGLYDIGLPMGECACATFGYDYAVAINFPNAFPTTARPDVVTDAAPLGCISYAEFGSGWTDMFTLASADFNNDGNMDLFYGGHLEDGYLSLGNGDGTFQAAAHWAAASRTSGAPRRRRRCRPA